MSDWVVKSKSVFSVFVLVFLSNVRTAAICITVIAGLSRFNALARLRSSDVNFFLNDHSVTSFIPKSRLIIKRLVILTC